MERTGTGYIKLSGFKEKDYRFSLGRKWTSENIIQSHLLSYDINDETLGDNTSKFYFHVHNTKTTKT